MMNPLLIIIAVGIGLLGFALFCLSKSDSAERGEWLTVRVAAGFVLAAASFEFYLFLKEVSIDTFDAPAGDIAQVFIFVGGLSFGAVYSCYALSNISKLARREKARTART